jgi:hypothetical protein
MLRLRLMLRTECCVLEVKDIRRSFVLYQAIVIIPEGARAMGSSSELCRWMLLRDVGWKQRLSLGLHPYLLFIVLIRLRVPVSILFGLYKPQELSNRTGTERTTENEKSVEGKKKTHALQAASVSQPAFFKCYSQHELFNFSFAPLGSRLARTYPYGCIPIRRREVHDLADGSLLGTTVTWRHSWISRVMFLGSAVGRGRGAQYDAGVGVLRVQSTKSGVKETSEVIREKKGYEKASSC